MSPRGPGAVLRDRIIEALKTDPVAQACGIPLASWADPDRPRIFAGLFGYWGGRNRGRLPFLEVAIDGQDMRRETRDSSTLVQTVKIRVHLADVDTDAADEKSEAILMTALATIRSEADGYELDGDDQMGPCELGVWGHTREATVTVEHSLDRNTYEVQ